jgi:hypothetical protein
MTVTVTNRRRVATEGVVAIGILRWLFWFMIARKLARLFGWSLLLLVVLLFVILAIRG